MLPAGLGAEVIRIDPSFTPLRFASALEAVFGAMFVLFALNAWTDGPRLSR